MDKNVSYKLIKKDKKDKNATVIESITTEHKHEFTVGEVKTNYEKLKKNFIEYDSMLKVGTAKVKNIFSHNRKLIESLTPEQIHAIWMYCDESNKVKKVNEQRNKANHTIKDYEEVIKHIRKDTKVNI